MKRPSASSWPPTASVPPCRPEETTPTSCLSPQTNEMDTAVYEIENVLRDYAWGSTTAIAGLLGRPESGRPEAELWVGAHPDSPSVATRPDGTAAPLNELIAE